MSKHIKTLKEEKDRNPNTKREKRDTLERKDKIEKDTNRHNDRHCTIRFCAGKVKRYEQLASRKNKLLCYITFNFHQKKTFFHRLQNTHVSIKERKQF
jgi:hypothetical protein